MGRSGVFFPQRFQDRHMGTPRPVWGYVLTEQPRKGWWTAFTPLLNPAKVPSRDDVPISTPTSSMQECLPSRPPLLETVQAPGPRLSLASEGRDRAGNGFVHDASMMTPGPEPQEWFLTSPVPSTEPAEKKKSIASKEKKKTLSAGKNTHIHRLK